MRTPQRVVLESRCERGGTHGRSQNAFAVVVARDRPWMGERAERVERGFEGPMLVAAALVLPDLILEESHVGPTLKTVARPQLGDVARVRRRACRDARRRAEPARLPSP
jgi:hypothetical protein